MAEEGVTILGAEHLSELGRRFKAEGNGDLRKEVLAGIRTAVKRMIPDVEESARDSLPRRGGLADRVAGQKFAARTSLATGRITLAGTGMKSMRDIDAGRVRHPLYGNRDVWFAQRVTPGFFSKPVDRDVPRVRSEIEGVISDAAKRLEKPL